MGLHKFIQFRPDAPAPEGKVFANIEILEGYNSNTLQDYKRMIALLKETFPEVDEDTVELGKISESDTYKRHAIISVTIPIERKEYEGWFIWDDDFQKHYYW
jgi:hypothetical protein